MNPLFYEAGAGDLPRLAGMALTALRVLLALFFFFVAGKNLAGDPQMAADFQRWGYPDWFRVATAFVQVVGGAMLLSTRVACIGATVLACVLVGATFTHLRNDPPLSALAPLAFLVLVALVFYGYRPPLLRG